MTHQNDFCVGVFINLELNEHINFAFTVKFEHIFTDCGSCVFQIATITLHHKSDWYMQP